jgi:hypothetical protein
LICPSNPKLKSDFPIDHHTDRVVLFFGLTIGVAIEVPDLWQDAAFCEDGNYFLDIHHLYN